MSICKKNMFVLRNNVFNTVQHCIYSDNYFSFLFISPVEVSAMAVGGTNTATAITLWEYSVFPSDQLYPDIVIHAYSVSL